jgi:DNA-binding NtrC family response regulator
MQALGEMAGPTPRTRVLVVDDEPLIRWSVSESLGERGYDVTEAGDAKGALATIAASAPFEVVLLDLSLPDSNDLGLLARLRRVAPHAHVILVTAHGTAEIERSAADLGAFAVVRKPFELSDLAAVVAHARASLGLSVRARSLY